MPMNTPLKILGNAIRKIRVDFGVPIEIDFRPIRKQENALRCRQDQVLGSRWSRRRGRRVGDCQTGIRRR